MHFPERVLAIVGSRKATRYAQMAIERIVPDLVEHNVCVVSGGALGADSMAHACTLEAGGKTVAILGSGLLELYPSTNIKLFESIVAEGGAIVSSFPLTTTAHPGNFPARNRVIAGLSHACLVVQAAARSGALITAQYALDQGKEVLAVPGMINDPLSDGCHALLRDGAFIATSAQDVLAVFGEMKNLVTIGSLIPSETQGKQLSVIECSSQESSLRGRIIRACTQPRALDDLVSEVGVGAEEVMQELFDLQLSGKLQQNFAGLWQAI
jgi:DNA processing protein